jgi:hypothetical protein
MAVNRFRSLVATPAAAALVAMSIGCAVFAAQPKTPEEFANLYMTTFNAKDSAGLHKLQYPLKGKSAMQEMMDQMTEAEMASGTKYTKFELQPAPPGIDKPSMGLDGQFYKPNIKPTHTLKLISVTKDGSSSTAFPIGVKDGIYYVVAAEVAAGAAPKYEFGWQKFTAPKSNWSVMLPNEPEPGRAALEKEGGKSIAEDPDAYGTVKNTADIKTCQHWFACGEPGKRMNADDNKERYRAACTTYEAETLQKWFSNSDKNLDDAVESAVRENGGKLVKQTNIDLNGAPGREYEVRDKDGTLHIGRNYWIKGALYELSFESKKEKPDLESANKFLSSLQVN